jgi:dihydrofolate reductase
MLISIIAAMAENRVIGRHNALPWDIPEDRKRFREITLGHPVIMGRKTYESLAGPLQGRKNIIVTRQRGYRAEGCSIAFDLASALRMAGGAEETFICGGGEIYREALQLAERIYLTVIHRSYPGDVFFPDLPPDFVTSSREDVDGDPSYSFLVYDRKHSKRYSR